MDSGAHTRIAKPLYPVRNWWVMGHTWHPDTIAKPVCQDRNWWILGRTPHRKTPLCGCQDRILPLGHYSDLILGKVKTSKRPCKRFRVTVSKPEARFGVAACPKAKLP